MFWPGFCYEVIEGKAEYKNDDQGQEREKRKDHETKTFQGLFMVDLKGIEPSNLTDANRALSQLSYKPIFS